MPVPAGTLLIADDVLRDMLDLPNAVGDEVEDFLNLLAANPNTVNLLPPPVETRKNSFYHQLPCGILVFWERLPARRLHNPILSQSGVKIRVLSVKFP
jgi:hypothetical protein